MNDRTWASRFLYAFWFIAFLRIWGVFGYAGLLGMAAIGCWIFAILTLGNRSRTLAFVGALLMIASFVVGGTLTNAGAWALPTPSPTAASSDASHAVNHPKTSVTRER